MSKALIISLVILVVLVAAFIALYFFGKKMQKKQMAQREQMREAAQMASMLIIDKKRMKIKDSGLPQVVIDQTPKLLRGSKLPVVKAKIGPQIMTLICDEKIFDEFMRVMKAPNIYIWCNKKQIPMYIKYFVIICYF